MNNITKEYLNIKSEVEKPFIKNGIPKIEIGDTVKIKRTIQEGNKERTQTSEGVVISKKNYSINTTITVRKVIHNIGVERVYLINSPKITNIEIVRQSKVKRSKLYYLRSRYGKATRLKQKI